jgi:FkbM family methyltransferase
MTITEFSLRAINKIPPAKSLTRKAIKRAVPSHADKIGWIYNRLSSREKSVATYLFAEIYSNGGKPGKSWVMEFEGEKIQMPLDNIKLDWGNSLLIAGHDVEVKDAYREILKSKPKVFFDIGANWGTHSLIFLAHGVRAISFEPNANCKKDFERYCRLNGFQGKMETIGLSDHEGRTKLQFPGDATWLGRLTDAPDDGATTMDVEITTLDAYVERTGLVPDVIKIDTEGHELNVVRGGRKTLSSRPPVIFESNSPKDRDEIYDEFIHLGYSLYSLPESPLTKQGFRSAKGTNFIAK